MLIGNELLLNDFQKLIDNGKIAQSLLIIGDKYMGKKYISKKLAEMLKKPFELLGQSIEALNDMRERVYTYSSGFCFIIPNLENYNYKAIDSLLKIIEEPPKNIYFIITCNNENKLKQTIRNRCEIFRLKKYSIEELKQYSKYKNYDILSDWYYMNIVYSPTLINYYQNKLDDYNAFVKKFINNIISVSAGNALKSAYLFNTGQENEDNLLIEFDLFLMFLSAIIIENFMEFEKIFILIISIIRKYNSEYRINGVDKLSLIKQFIIDYRQVFLKNGFNNFSINY